MTTEAKKAAKEFAEDAMVLHWQPRVKAERENRAPFGQITTVKDCYAHGFLAGDAYGYARGFERCKAQSLKILERVEFSNPLMTEALKILMETITLLEAGE